MKVEWEQGNEAKLTEEKRKKMNDLIGLNNISVSEKITLLISDWCSEHIKTLHKEYPNEEWLAICKVEPQGNGTFLMTDMIFPHQTTTSWDVETTKEWMEWLTNELIERWERMKDWNCVLHSHHRMGCFWSGTDDNARLGLNDWRQLAWSVVTAYKDNEIDYKGCINFYKPYNIEIDVDVRDICDTLIEYKSVVQRYEDYLKRVEESEARFYEFLIDINKNYIESITDRPSYSNMLDYLWVDITQELNANYNKLRDKIWNPELVEYMKMLWEKAHELAVNEMNKEWKYTDLLIEYEQFCKWSDELLDQLEKHKEKKVYTLGKSSSSLFGDIGFPLNRDFESYGCGYDYEPYEFTSPQYDEGYIRAMFGIDSSIKMKVGKDKERMAWSEEDKDYLYVEDWSDNMYY